MNDAANWTVENLDITWDVTRPSQVSARQAIFNDTDPDGVSGGTSDSGLKLLGTRGLADFATKPMSVMLTTQVDDAGELGLRAASLLRESGWFVTCHGEADAARLNAILRVGDIVSVNNIGTLHSGNYYVWSVKHTINQDTHKMKFELLRNAIGPQPSASTSTGSVL
jgi:hypothetical protein